MYAPLSASIAVANDPRATDVDREVLLAPQKVPGHLIYIFIRIKRIQQAYTYLQTFLYEPLWHSLVLLSKAGVSTTTWGSRGVGATTWGSLG